MASVMRMIFLCLVGIVSLISLSSSLPGLPLSTNYVDLSDVIGRCIKKAVNELSIRKQKETHYFSIGNDRSLTDGYLWHHALFMLSSDRGKVSQLYDKAYIALKATKELVKQTKKPVEVLQSDPKLVMLWRNLIAPHCNCPIPVCNLKDQYRTIDGTCNNLDNPTWGAAMKPQLRYLPAAFADGLYKPRMYSITGQLLPSARVVSNALHNTGTCKLDDNGNSVVLMSWGQFIDHDFIGTPVTKGFNNSDIMCCTLQDSLADQRGSCFPIKIPHDDQRFRTKCMNFVRSTIAPTDYCDIGVRNPLNQHSSYIDGSLIYGSTPEVQKRLRAFTGGLLKISQIGLMPPTDRSRCMTTGPHEYCFDAGDDRHSVVPSLAVFHILFLREHNRICKELSFYNPFWSDEKIFQETRKIIAAMLQHVTYNEYLPRILSHVHMSVHGLYSSPAGHHTVYNPNVNPTISNAFGAAAFRFGHSQIPHVQGHVEPRTGHKRTIPVEHTFNRPNMIFANNGRGNLWNTYWQLNSLQARQDRVLQDGVRNNLFLDRRGRSLDLASLNIQRGRDHGVPSYNAWRKWCGFKPAFHFGTVAGGLIHHDEESARLLSKVYSHPEDIDLFTGGLSEIVITGTLTGPTFACIIARQFQFLKEGDRFWYENNFKLIGFTKAQLNEIKKVRLSHIMCNNLDIRQIQINAFEVPSFKNPKIGCEFFPKFDLRHWSVSNYEKSVINPINRHGAIFYTTVKSPYNPVPLWTAAYMPRSLVF